MAVATLYGALRSPWGDEGEGEVRVSASWLVIAWRLHGVMCVVVRVELDRDVGTAPGGAPGRVTFEAQLVFVCDGLHHAIARRRPPGAVAHRDAPRIL